MELTGWTVDRGLVLLELDEHGELRTVRLDAKVAIARCCRCKRRFRRVLPCDAVPRKTYGLPVIEHEVSEYTPGDRSLRKVAWSQLGDRTPAHTTLHGWTEGLGAHALGRPGGDAGGAPMNHLVANAQSRIPEVDDVMRAEVHPDPRRYRSEARRDRLAAVIRTMVLATTIAGMPHPHAMSECRRLALLWSGSSVFVFPSRILETPIEQGSGSKPPRSRSSFPRSRDRCPTRTRSPPGASSRSPS
jgi:hypothetical protein